MLKCDCGYTTPVRCLRCDASSMTKRELFAAMAMQGLAPGDVSQVMRVEQVLGHKIETGSLSVMIAKSAVKMADALIAELKKGEE